MRIEREGNQRWLYVPMPPEQLWPQLRAFWQERGFNLVVDEPETGVMETDWAENRAKIPEDLVRSAARPRVRLASTPPASATSSAPASSARPRRQRGLHHATAACEEVYTTCCRTRPSGSRAPSDPQLEAEFLSRLMVKLGAPRRTATVAANAPAATTAAAAPGSDAARAARASSTVEPAPRCRSTKASTAPGAASALALDRSGFTVEDRDRTGGLYFVRYVDPADAGKEEPGFCQPPVRQQGRPRRAGALSHRGEARRRAHDVSVQNAQGAPETATPASASSRCWSKT